MTDPNPNLDPDEVDEVEQANVAAAAIAGFTLAQLAFGELIRNGILPKDAMLGGVNSSSSMSANCGQVLCNTYGR